MTIRIRTTKENGFWKKVENTSETNCDSCKEKLWIAPDDSIYCNNWEVDHEQS